MSITLFRLLGVFLCCLLAIVILFPIAGSSATFTVVNTNDVGAGSLRQALLDANNSAGADVISFQIPGPKPYTITPLSPLPSITDAVEIDGTTQTNFTGQPIIQLNGASAGANANGLLILGGSSSVHGLVINRFQRSGIRIEGAGTNAIQGNFLGTDVNGTNYAGNGEGGVYIYQSPGNLIGGTNTLARNLLSGSNLAGIFIENPRATGNKVVGNFIGTDITGTLRLGNKNNGIVLANAPGNIVGGTAVAERNIISGNEQSGIYLLSSGASANWITGNYIGTDVTGNVPLSNAADGVTLYRANNNTVGGTNDAARNIISGNGQYGVFITSGALSNQVQGNYIGTAVTGTGGLGNGLSGVGILGAPSNLVGGTSVAARNIITANKESGIYIAESGAVGNFVQGNFIGTDATGANPLGNIFNGVIISDFASNNIVGGTTPGAGNVISANFQTGVYLVGEGSGSNAIQGNFIGTDSLGHAKLGNAFSGMRVETPLNLIGGATPAARNLISANGQNGIYLYSAGASNNVIQGNFVGTDAGGSALLGNRGSGIGLSNAPANLIGGALPGSGNLISGNSNMAIYLQGARASGNVMQGNYMGTDATGSSALPNGSALLIADIAGGIDISAAPSNIIGGSVAGAGNLISGNIRDAIAIGDAGAAGNVIQGNLIGTGADGIRPLGNEWHGVEIRIQGGGGNTLIGGLEPGAGNVLAYATLGQRSGVRIRDGGGNNGILVRGNSIFSNGGPNATGYAIDLGAVGVTANDNCDADSGANLHQNFPILTNAQAMGDITEVRGTLNSAANKTFLLQFYASALPETSGNVEGKIYMGDGFVTTDGNCCVAFKVELTNGVAAGQWLTATATDSANNTSEFSAAVAVMASATITITSQPTSRTNTLGTAAAFSVSAAGEPPLSYQWNRNGTDLIDGGTISGATTTNLTLAGVDKNDAAYYSVIIRNASGSVTSSVVTLTVISPPAITIGHSGSSITLSWPAVSQGFAAQQAASLTPPISWTAVTNTPDLVGDQYILTVTPANATVFYRLIFH